MATHFLQDPDFTRFGFLPLSYYMKHLAMNKELILDHIDGMAYYYLEDKKEYIPLNDPTAIYHLRDYNNPHQVTKEQVGLGEVDNIRQAPLKDFNKHINDFNNPHRVTKEQIGLGNVNNVIPIPKSEFDLYNKTIEKYIEELKNLQESIEFFASDRYRLTINTDPEDAIVRVRYNKKWNVGKLHKLPDGTYKFEVEWGGDTEPDDEEGSKPKEEKKYKVKIYKDYSYLDSTIIKNLYLYFEGYYIKNKKDEIIFSKESSNLFKSGYLYEEIELPEGEYEIYLIPSYGNNLIKLEGFFKQFLVENNNNNEVELRFITNNATGVDFNICTKQFFTFIPSENGNHAIDSYFNIYTINEGCFSITDSLYKFDKELFRELYEEKGAEGAQKKAFVLDEKLSKLKSERDETNNYELLSIINNNADTIFVYNANYSNKIGYFLKKENNNWDIKKEIDMSTMFDEGDIVYGAFFNITRKISWLSPDIFNLNHSKLIIDLKNMNVLGKNPYSNHIESYNLDMKFDIISNNSKYAINSSNSLKIFNIFKLNNLNNKYEKIKTIQYPDKYKSVSSNTYFKAFDISNDGNEMFIGFDKKIYYVKIENTTVNWVCDINYDGSYGIDLDETNIDKNIMFGTIKIVGDYDNKKMILIRNFIGDYDNIEDRIKLDFISIYSFKNNYFIKEYFNFPLNAIYEKSTISYYTDTAFYFHNLIFIENIGLVGVLRINKWLFPLIIKKKYKYYDNISIDEDNYNIDSSSGLGLSAINKFIINRNI